MSLNFDKIQYYCTLLLMAIRGFFHQIIRLRYRGIILMGPGCRVYGYNNLHINGIIKIGAYSTVDARFCDGIYFGDKFSLGDYSIIRASGDMKFVSPGISFGDNVSFGPYCNIGGGYGVEIKKNCIFGPYVSIHPESHVCENIDVPIRSQGIYGTGILINENNWFSSKVTILDGVNIDSGCVFGAAAVVVSGNYGGNSVYVGIPARKIKNRS